MPNTDVVTAALEVVRKFVNDEGDCPTCSQLTLAFAAMFSDWQHQKDCGLDIVASAVLDEMEAVIRELRDL